MKAYQKLVGDRLFLSPFDPQDEETCEKWAAWMNDPEVAENYGGASTLVSLSEAKKTLADLTGYRFSIVLRESGELIGHVSIHDVDLLNRNAFLGIVIGSSRHRGRGYGGEALRLILAFAFQTLNLHGVMLTVHEDNRRAIACYKKLGFAEVGRRREWVFKGGKYVDKLYMELLDREFLCE